MLVALAPYRISFAGGGTDIPFFYQRAPGAVLSATINKYVYIAIHPFYRRDEILLKYSKTESVTHVDQIEHTLFREALKFSGVRSGVEIASVADIPAQTGMGSSSSFSVALLNALWAHRGQFLEKKTLAELACELEIDRLGDPVGKQDQYAAAFGGLNLMTFASDGVVQVSPVPIAEAVRTALQQRLMLFYLCDQRRSYDVLHDQAQAVGADQRKFQQMSRMADLAHEMRDLLAAGQLDDFALKLDEGWRLKRGLSAKISKPTIDRHYERAREAGALGGKLLGAGGGGFLLLFVESERQEAVRSTLAELTELPFRFENEGSRVLRVGDISPDEGFIYRT
jgi:D-glycero-alpha-D-manno-heptose-7-phosphate kinase